MTACDRAQEKQQHINREKGGVQVVPQSAMECLFTCYVCSGLVLHSWHAARLSCFSQYSSSVITCPVVLPSPWP